MKRSFRRRSKKVTSFNPGHDELAKATAAFLEKGGKVTKLNDVSEYYGEFLTHKESVAPADEFLLNR